eukprot:12953408-Alexandrium_andersonii.AAC.1
MISPRLSNNLDRHSAPTPIPHPGRRGNRIGEPCSAEPPHQPQEHTDPGRPTVPRLVGEDRRAQNSNFLSATDPRSPHLRIAAATHQG